MVRYFIIAQAILGLAAALPVLGLFRGSSRSTWLRLVWLFALGALMAIVGVIVGVLIGNRFAVANLWFHAVTCVLAPATIVVGLLGLRCRPGGHRGWGSLAAIVGSCVLGLGVYAARIEPFRLQVTRHVVMSERLPVGAPPIRVAVLADIQTDRVGRFEERVFRTLDGLTPDLILLPGDYLQCPTEEDLQGEQLRLAALFNGLQHQPRLGIFGVDGDVDFASQSLAGTTARALKDERVVLEDGVLQVIGLSTPSSRRDLRAEDVAAIEAFPGLTIVCGHAPDHMRMVLQGRFEGEALFVAGHTHGGQIVVPGFGPPVTLSSVPRWLAAGGSFRVDGSHLVVSRGIGLERGYAPRVRFLCPPEIVVLELSGPLR